MQWSDLSVMITGGTGSFGKKFTEIMLREINPRRLIIFSRDELKQHEMKMNGFDDERLRYFIGDVRDVSRLRRAMNGVDIVVHAAALKQVPACEFNPIEAIATNVDGAKNIIDAALDTGVKKVLALSTDKAVSPANLYGATKLVAEKLFTQANVYTGAGPTRFSCVRYGNVLGSRGSVVPLFLEQRKNGKLTITDPRMTRFWITLESGAKFVINCIERMHGGEVFVPKLPSTNIMEVAEAMASTCKIESIGIRPGEKLHECLISEDEARDTRDAGPFYVIQPAHPWWNQKNWAQAMPVAEDFRYASDTNTERLTIPEIQQLIGVTPEYAGEATIC